MISFMEYLQLMNIIHYLVHEIENLKKDNDSMNEDSSDNSALETSVSTLQTNLDKLYSEFTTLSIDFINYKNQVDMNLTHIDTLKQEVAELSTKE